MSAAEVFRFWERAAADMPEAQLLEQLEHFAAALGRVSRLREDLAWVVTALVVEKRRRGLK